MVVFVGRASNRVVRRDFVAVHVAFPSRVVDKIKSGQAVISARPNWLNGTWIVHS